MKVKENLLNIYKSMKLKSPRKTSISISKLILIGTLLTIYSQTIFAQNQRSEAQISLRDKYGLYALTLETKGMLDYAYVDYPEFVDFTALMVRDIFPEKEQGLRKILSTNNEFTKRAAVDSVKNMVAQLKPYPLNKMYIGFGKGYLSEYDFNQQRFKVIVTEIDNFKTPGQGYFRKKTGPTTFRYLNTDEIPVPVQFSRPMEPSADIYSIYHKKWDFIPLEPKGAQELLKSLEEVSGSQKRDVFFRFSYTPIIHQGHLVANISEIFYCKDSDFQKVIHSFTDQNSGIQNNLTVDEKSKLIINKGNFSNQSYIRELETTKIEKYRYVMFKGILVSNMAELNGREFYYSALYEVFKFDEERQNYMPILASPSVDDRIAAVFWIQIGNAPEPIWVEGYYGNEMYYLTGKKGLPIGKGKYSRNPLPKLLKDFEFSVNLNSDRSDFQFILFDNKGREVASCIIYPISDDTEIKNIDEMTGFINQQ